MEELLADAYAGINAFGANAGRYQAAVQERLAELDLVKSQQQSNGTKQTNGPNGEMQDEKNTAKHGDVRYSVADGRITEDSTEEERYEMLKDVVLTVAKPNMEKIADINLEDYNTRKKSSVEPGLKALAGKLGIINIDLKNSYIDSPFQFSNRGLSVSLHHQLEYGGTYQDYILALSCFEDLIENAVPIEVHSEKKKGTTKENTELKRTIVLVSAFRNNNALYPVQMEVKEYVSRDSKLYLIVALKKIEPEVLETSDSSKAENPSPLFPGSAVSLQHIFSNVNPQDKRFLKYVPDGFLNNVQKVAKQKALEEQRREYKGYSKVKGKTAEKWVPWYEVSFQELNQAQFEGRYDNDTKMVRVNVYDGVNMAEDSKIYSYDFLTALPDMQVVTLPEVVDIRDGNNRIDTRKVVENGMKNARTVGTEQGGKVFVRNKYTNRILLVTSDSIRHGLNGNLNRLLTNARLGAVIGDVIQNAVPINALHNRAEGVAGTYAMAGYATDSNGRKFVAIVTVEEYSGNVSGVEVYDVAHAVSGRQKRDRQASTKLQGFYPIKAVDISIADLLRVVKDTHQSVLSEDVLNHLGEVRNPEGDYTDKVKFSIDDASAMEQELERLESEEYQRQLMESGGAAAVVRNQKEIEQLKWRMRRDPETIQKREQRDMQTEPGEGAKVHVPRKGNKKEQMPSESKPILAKQDLRKHLLTYFSIPDGQRKELGDYIDRYISLFAIKSHPIGWLFYLSFFSSGFNSWIIGLCV